MSTATHHEHSPDELVHGHDDHHHAGIDARDLLPQHHHDHSGHSHDHSVEHSVER